MSITIPYGTANRIHSTTIQLPDKEPQYLGVITTLEFNSLPFIPKRSFVISNVPVGGVRGNHANRVSQQVLICVCGGIHIQLQNGQSMLDRDLVPGDTVFVNKMVWNTVRFDKENTVLWSICSEPYNKKDYITNFKDFILEALA